MTERRGGEEERKSKEMSSCQVMRTGTIIEFFLGKNPTKLNADNCA